MEEKNDIRHLLYCPFSGLGLYRGFRGNRWLNNRIRIFTQFVLPSLCAQTTHNFILWCSWRPEEKRNPIVQNFMRFMDGFSDQFKTVHTFHGVCFWDDKYPDDVARARLLNALHGSVGELTDVIGECKHVLMTIQPSDDLYDKQAFEKLQEFFSKEDYQAGGFAKGYIINYLTKDVNEYNPQTNPPFFTIKFPRDVFINPQKHADYTGPYKSHEYVPDKLKYMIFEDRGFMVGTHTENISTHFNHPFKGADAPQTVLEDFGIAGVETLKLKFSLRKKILRMLPHPVQRKLRYWFGEKLGNRLYEFFRS